MTEEKRWKTYEEITKHIINDIRKHLGLNRVEEKQRRKGLNSNTDWEIDAVAYDDKSEGLVLIECRFRSKSKINQEAIAGLAYRIKDTGAERGIIVTTIGLQEGAKKVAKAEKIAELKIDPNSTDENYIASLANIIFAKFTEYIKIRDHVVVELRGKDGKVIDRTEVG